MSGGKAEARAKSDNVVGGTGGSRFGGVSDSGLVGGAYRGRGRDGRDRNCDGQLIKWGGYYSKHNLRDRA